MLKVFLGDMDEVIYNTSVYFKYNYQPSWLEDPDVIQMILDVDRSKVLGNGAVESPVMGIIAPVSLSGGVKTLILIDKVPDKVFNASNCGDNCAAWLLRIGSPAEGSFCSPRSIRALRSPSLMRSGLSIFTYPFILLSIVFRTV